MESESSTQPGWQLVPLRERRGPVAPDVSDSVHCFALGNFRMPSMLLVGAKLRVWMQVVERLKVALLK